MSEEQEGGISTIKKTIIGIVTTAVTAAGVYVTTHIEQLLECLKKSLHLV